MNRFSPIIIALFTCACFVVSALFLVTMSKAMELEQRTLDLMRQVDEQRAQLAIHTKALNELYGRDGK